MGEVSKVICVVDDDKAFCLLCVRLLEPEGYKCVVVNDGSTSLEAVKRLRPDLLMMDLRMGEVDGMEALNDLNADPEVTGIPVVICTAAHDLVEKHRARLNELGCEIVLKPFEIDDLLGAIERCLARAAERGRYSGVR